MQMPVAPAVEPVGLFRHRPPRRLLHTDATSSPWRDVVALAASLACHLELATIINFLSPPRSLLTDFAIKVIKFTSDFNKATKQKIDPPAATVIMTSSGITAQEPQQNPVLVFSITITQKRVRPPVWIILVLHAELA